MIGCGGILSMPEFAGVDRSQTPLSKRSSEDGPPEVDGTKPAYRGIRAPRTPKLRSIMQTKQTITKKMDVPADKAWDAIR